MELSKREQEVPSHYKRERHRKKGEVKARTIRETLTQGLLGRVVVTKCRETGEGTAAMIGSL